MSGLEKDLGDRWLLGSLLGVGIFGIEDTKIMMKKLDCPENVGRLAK